MRFVKEIFKTLILALLVLLGLFFWQAFGLSKESTPAKAKRIQERGGNIRFELTRDERDEYMDYLRALSGYTFENGTTNDPIFTIELP
jgi:hypothetical protein